MAFPIKHFLYKEGQLEYQKNYIFWSIFLYITATAFLIYTTVGTPDDSVWNALFWVTQIFVCINAISKSFLGEPKEQLSFYYFLLSPQQFIISKLIYNLFLTFIFISITLVCFIFFLGMPQIKLFPYWCLALFASIGFSNTFTFLSAIAAKARQNSSFVAILGFPLIMPQIMLINKLTDAVFSNSITTPILITGGILFSLDVMTFLLAIILYPFLWKE